MKVSLSNIFITSYKVFSYTTSRVFQAVVKPFLWLKDLFGRYLGSKLECGYRFGAEQKLTPKEAAQYLPFISASAYGFSGKADCFVLPIGWTPILPSELNFKDQNLLPNDHGYFDKKSGLKISFVEKEDQALIVIPGLIVSRGDEHSGTNRDCWNGFLRDPAKGLNILGVVPTAYLQAEEAITAFLALDRLQGKKITLVGQCYGGSIVSYVALKKGLKAVCFNSLQLGAGVQAKIGKEALRKADSLITHFLIENDWLTSSKIANVFDRILTFLNIRTPGNFGKRVIIPSAYSSSAEAHGYVLGSLMAYLGKNRRTLPEDLDADWLRSLHLQG